MNHYYIWFTSSLLPYLVLQIDQAKKALSHLYGPEYPVSEEVEIIRHHLEHHAKVSGKEYMD